MGVQRAIDYMSFTWSHYNWTMMLNTSTCFCMAANSVPHFSLLFLTVIRSLHNAQYAATQLEYFKEFFETVRKKYSLDEIDAAIKAPEYDPAKYKMALAEQYFEVLINMSMVSML